MKLPAEPESRRAETEITVLETISERRWRVGHFLDRGLDGTHHGSWWTKGTRQYHVPLAPQYKHRCCVSRLCLSDAVRRCVSVCIGCGGL